MNHFTDKGGYNGIGAQPIWQFIASKPPGNHPFGAYFTTLNSDHPKLAQKLRLPKEKLEYLFQFVDEGDLTPLPGGRGLFIFFSPQDYHVDIPRQLFAGKV